MELNLRHFAIKYGFKAGTQPYLSTLSFLLALQMLVFAHADGTGVSNIESRDGGVVYAPVFEKLKKGVNQDANMPDSGAWVRVQHHPNHMKAIKAAGFESVRFFMPAGGNIDTFTQRIQDAVDNDLAVVVCMWGSSSWANRDIAGAVTAISNRWRTLATRWVDFPNDVVFEVLNEVHGIGYHGESTFADAMQLYNGAVKAIRAVDPDRPILIAPPGFNDSDKLDPWVSEDYLDYTLGDGRGFFEDPNIGVAIHFYRPNNRRKGGNWGMGTEPLKADWKEFVDYEIDHAVDWKTQYHTNMPIIVSEWGCWLFESRSKTQLNDWLDYHLGLFEKNNFGSMWYTGVQSNQRQFAIFDSEYGWNPLVLPRLTGVEDPEIPATPQLIDSEFFRNSKTWILTSSRVKKSITTRSGEVLSGNTSVKIEVPGPTDCQIYQQTLGNDDKGRQAPGRTMLHLLKGATYKISFMAKTLGDEGAVKVRLKDAGNLDTTFFDSGLQTISEANATYTFTYTHKAETADDVRFEFDLGSRAQTLILDNVVFVRGESTP